MAENVYRTTSVVVAQTASLSAEFDIGDHHAVAIFTPSALEAGTTTLTFAAAQVSGGTFYPVVDDAGVEATVTCVINAAQAIPLDSVLAKIAPFRYLKIRCGTEATPVAQATAARTFVIALK